MKNDERVIVVGQCWQSSQNGQVYDPRGLSPTLVVGHHAGVEPKIIVYEDEQDDIRTIPQP
jgi:hypothetical protein